MRSMSLSASEKVAITVTCQAFIDTVLKSRFLSTVTVTSFNYSVDIKGKWHGRKYRFLQRYRAGFDDNRGEEIGAPFVRLDWISPDHFDVQWRRHTGQWFRVLSLKSALNAIITDGLLHLH